jgi:hypothetical protein
MPVLKLYFGALASIPFAHIARITNQRDTRLLAAAKESDYVSVHKRDITQFPNSRMTPSESPFICVLVRSSFLIESCRAAR